MKQIFSKKRLLSDACLKARGSSAKGFTLVELLIAMTVFAIFIAILASSYLFLTRSQRDTNELRKLYSEGRFLMDEVVSVARGSQIAYECYDAVLSGDGTCYDSSLEPISGTISGTALAVMNPEGKRVVVKLDECEESACLKKVVQVMGETGWVPSEDDGYYSNSEEGFQTLNLENIEVNSAHFVISPGVESAPEAPHVSIYLSLTGDSQIRDEVNFDIQTTVSLRDY